jgi:invasion protein IalB
MNYPYSNLLRSLTFIIACLFQVVAHAEAKVGDRFGDWIFECRAISADKTICALSQIIALKENNKVMTKLSLRNDKSKGEPELIALVPLGVYLPSGVTGTFDQGRPFQFTVQRCTQQSCIASVKADSVMLKTMQSSEKVAISFSGQADAKPIVLTGSLKGLAEGLKAINLK